MKKKISLLIFVLFLFVSMGYSSNGKTVRGCILHDNDLSRGIVSFNTNSPEVLTINKTLEFDVAAGAYANDAYYVFLMSIVSGGYTKSEFGKLDLTTGVYTPIKNYLDGGLEVFTDMTYDYSTRSMLAIGMGSSPETKSIKSIDLTTGEATTLCIIQVEFTVIALACDYSGRLYGIVNDGYVGEIDKTTGQFYSKGHVGIMPRYIQSMEFDHSEGVLYWAAIDHTGAATLRVVDLSGNAQSENVSTAIGSIGPNGTTEIAGLYIPFTPLSIDAPGKVTSITIQSDPTKNPLEATISWINPTKKLNETTDLPGNLTGVKVYRNGTLIATVTSSLSAGANASYTDNNIPQAGKYEYSLVAVNAEGNGYPSKKSLFIGEDVPAAPNAVTLAREGNDAVIKWEASNIGLNGGYINKNNLKYTITRLPDNIVVAQDLAATTYKDIDLPIVKTYSYSVQAKTTVGIGGVAVSNEMVLGESYSIPYGCDFESNDVFAPWTVINLNNDDHCTWARTAEGTARYWFNVWSNADDWMISPAIYMPVGRYTLSFDYRCSSSDDRNEKMKVFYGQGATVSAQTNMLVDFPKIDNVIFKRAVINVDISVAGDYNFGFYAYSDAHSEYIHVDNVLVEKLVDNDLSAVSVNGFGYPIVGNSYKYNVKIENRGTIAQSNYQVQLINSNNEVLASKTVTEEINIGDSKIISVDYTPTVDGIFRIRGSVVLSNDQQPENNISTPLKLEIQPINGDSFVIIGDGVVGDGIEENYNLPLDYFYYTFATQTIYTENDMQVEGGLIRQIRYPYNNYLEAFTKPIKLYLANTQRSNLKSGWIPMENMTLVYDGMITMELGLGEIVIDLPVPFLYSGNNLCVMNVRDYEEDVVINAKFYITTTEESCSRVYKSGTTPFDGTQAGTTDNSFPKIVFQITSSGAGKIKGTVISNGEPLNDVALKTTPLGLTTSTNEDGEYEFGYISADQYSIEASKFGYFDKVSTVNVVSGQTSLLDIEMMTLPKFNVSGIVKNIDGVNVSGATVILTGYDDYTTSTNDQGEFTINGVFKADEYTLSVRKLGLTSHSRKVNIVDSDITLPLITLKDVANPPINIVASSTESSSNISWTETDQVLFRYDNGVAVSQLGFQEGISTCVMGSAYKTPAILTGMSWLTRSGEDLGAPHEKVTVYVFDLNSEGLPNSNVLFTQSDVPNVDDVWTSYSFPTPVECPNGFMIAIGYEGFMALALDSGKDSDWPFVPNANYISAPYTTNNFIPIVGSEGANFFMRGTGYVIDYKRGNGQGGNECGKISNIENYLEKEVIRSYSNQIIDTNVSGSSEEINISGSKGRLGYRVWRLLDEQRDDQSLWTELTTQTISATDITDNSWGTLPNGAYRYAVKACYKEEVLSVPAFSNMLPKGMHTVVNMDITTNTPTNEANGAIVTITNNDNNTTHVYTSTVNEGRVFFADVWKGIYNVKIVLNGFETIEETNIDMTEETVNLNYRLNELIITPYNLEVVDTEINSEKIFNWNTVEYISDDFEDHISFEINPAGSIGWSYIDADEKTTNYLSTASFPNQGLPMAYIVFAPNETNPPLSVPALNPYSGNKYLASFASIGASNQDFIVSPKLSFSKDFVFSFWAKSYTARFGLERIKVGYSTTGNKKADFNKWLTTSAYISVPEEEWVKYSYNVPANAKYVTIECVSDDAFVLMLDDIFIGKEQSRAFTTYEVYLNGDKVGQTATTSYKFKDLEEGNYTAGVKAIHTSGNSETSTIDFTVTLVGVDTFDYDNIIRVYPNPMNDVLNIEGEYQLLQIYNAMGKLVMTVKSQTNVIDVHNLKSGVYIVRILNNDNTTTYKMTK